MNSENLADLEVSTLANLISSGDASPVEVTEACLNRISERNETLNAFATTTGDMALEKAKLAESEIVKGNYLGPLHGIPIAHKDLYQTKAVKTTAGSRVLEDFIPESDSTVVARLNKSGMVMLGKTNTHEFAYGPTNEVSLFGPVSNPWNTERISGGSSGGSAAAVAGGLVPIATGSDTGGSIRIPSSMCGLTGLKPTYGRVSRAGIFPLCWSMDHAGPLAKSALDAALLLEAIAGPDTSDRSTLNVPAITNLQDNLTGDIAGLRIGVPRHYFYSQARNEIVDCIDEILQSFQASGAEIIDIQIPDIDYAVAAALAIYLAEATAYHDDTLGQSPHLYSESVRGFLELGDQLLAKDYIHAQRYRTLLGERIKKAFDNVDVLATPATPITASKINQAMVDINGTDDSVFAAALRNTEPFNLTGLPAVVAPCGQDTDGLPISIQIVAPAYSEALVLNVIHHLQLTTDWHRRKPSSFTEFLNTDPCI